MDWLPFQFAVMFVILDSMLLGTTPSPDVGKFDTVELIEVNHKFGADGKHVFDQIIFWERRPESGRLQVRAWYMIEDRETINRRPIRTAGGMYETTMLLENNLLKKVRSRQYRESWTDFDPEQEDAKKLPSAYRNALSKPFKEQ